MSSLDCVVCILHTVCFVVLVSSLLEQIAVVRTYREAGMEDHAARAVDHKVQTVTMDCALYSLFCSSSLNFTSIYYLKS